MGDYRTKIPVWVVFLLLANILLVMALEVLLLYRVPLPLTDEVLAEADNRFAGTTLSQPHQRGYLHCTLAENPDGNVYLIPIRAHGVFFGRGRLLEKHIVPVAPEGETSVDIKVGMYTSTVTVSSSPEPWMEPMEPIPLCLFIDHSASGSGSSMAIVYIALGAVITFLELELIRLPKGR